MFVQKFEGEPGAKQGADDARERVDPLIGPRRGERSRVVAVGMGLVEDERAFGWRVERVFVDEAVVEEQLARVRGRIRSLDAGAYLLLFSVLTVAYALTLAVLDSAFELPQWARLLTFTFYALGGAVFLAMATWCYLRPINPYYAAIQLEQTLPKAKNSLVQE